MAAKTTTPATITTATGEVIPANAADNTPVADPTKPRTRTATTRRARTAKPKAVEAATVQADALVAEAAPTIVGEDGSMVRDTKSYTVDLLAEGTENEKRDWAALVEKDPSENAIEFAEWVAEKSGLAIDPKAVQVVLATYKEFQSSPEHKAKTIAKRQAAAAAKGAKVQARKERAAKAASQLSKAELEAMLAEMQD